MPEAAAAGIARDFRNVLAALLGQADAMLARLDGGTLDTANLREGLLSLREVAREAIVHVEGLLTLSPAAEAAPPAVLVVEDDRVFGALLEELLGAEGWNVRVVGDTASAFEALTQQTFQVVLTDLVLPEEHGWVIARAARHRNPRCRVVVMSGAMGPEDADPGAPAVDAFLTKPIDLDRLLAVLAALSPRAARG
ncbi:MAG: response regulator [Candidatus Rokubacteria bacterium]|nr:response regulator [Candidatus Rokubacteria bacterium]